MATGFENVWFASSRLLDILVITCLVVPMVLIFLAIVAGYVKDWLWRREYYWEFMEISLMDDEMVPAAAPALIEVGYRREDGSYVPCGHVEAEGITSVNVPHVGRATAKAKAS